MAAANQVEQCTDMYAHLAFWAERTPYAPAYHANDVDIRYTDLKDQVDRLAGRLLAQGVRPGDRIAVVSHPAPEPWVLFLAASAIGAVWIALNPRYTPREVRHVLSDSRPLLLFAVPNVSPDQRRAVVDGSADIGYDLPVVELSLARYLADTSPATELIKQRRTHLDEHRPGLIVYTSGTTGAPKGAVLSSDGMARSFEIQARNRPQPTIRNVANLPMNHIGGIGDLCCTPLVLGGSTVFQSRFDPAAMISAMRNLGVDTIMQIPTTLKLLVDHPDWDPGQLGSLRSISWGGAPMPAEMVRYFLSLGLQLRTTYGLTEITGSISYTTADATVDELSFTVGRPIEEVSLRFVDEHGADVPSGTPGEIAVRHPGRLLEYFGNAEATAAAINPDGYFLTGDIGYLDDNGNLVLVGRTSEMFKSGGENIYPREIEKVLESHPLVAQASVVARPDDIYDEIGVAFVVCTDRSDRISDDLSLWCRQYLANYKVPAEFHVLDELPRLDVGKVDRRGLMARAASPANAGESRSDDSEPNND